jgi:hypothetical protein
MKKIKFYPFNDNASRDIDSPLPASRYIPEWYRKQPGSINDDASIVSGTLTSTVKRCMPIFDAMTIGYMFVAPCDIFIDATDPEKLVKSVPAAIKMGYSSDTFATHAPEQYSHFPIDSSIYHKELLRINTFWSAGTERGTSSIIMQPIHQDVSSLMAITGLVDTDKMITDGHFSFLVKKGFKGVIKQGTPLAQIIPFERSVWQSEVVDQEVAKQVLQAQRFKLRRVFGNAYKNLLRSKKEYR